MYKACKTATLYRDILFTHDGVKETVYIRIQTCSHGIPVTCIDSEIQNGTLV